MEDSVFFACGKDFKGLFKLGKFGRLSGWGQEILPCG
jgi:hypothetical protein